MNLRVNNNVIVITDFQLKENNNDRWWFYGVTKDPTKNDLLLVYHYDGNLPVNLLGVTLNYKMIDKLHNTINELMINGNDLSVKANKTIETIIETLKQQKIVTVVNTKKYVRMIFINFMNQ